MHVKAIMNLAQTICKFLILLITIAGPANAVTLHVAVDQPGADDANSGQSLENAFLSLEKAMAEAQAGDTILVHGGTYQEWDLRFANSGQEGAYITLAAAPGEEVILDGGGNDGSGILIIPGQGFFVIEGLMVTNMGWSGIATDETTTQIYHDITVRGCTLSNNGWCGLELSAVDFFLVEDVLAHGNGFYGLNIIASEDGVLSSCNGVVRNCEFRNHTGEEGHGMAVNQGHHIEVSNCRAVHNRIHGFDVSDWPKGGEVSHHVYFMGNHSEDNGVAGFCVNSDSHHIMLIRNVAWKNGAAWAGHGSSSGFLSYEGLWEVEFLGNVAVGNSDRGFAIDDPAGAYMEPENHALTFLNNISWQNGNPDWDECFGVHICQGAWDLDMRCNNWGGCPGNEEAGVIGLEMQGESGAILAQGPVNAGEGGEGNISVDPLFVDEANGDFRLAPESPLVDAGCDSGMPYTGSAPDMGAFEQ
ncbi:MAG: hypothetical protein D6E12_17195 [Desulfovibrio sp.]|nr:MAG: hypothetical protein D6E12_17195 [Desulfovibrio sp.]